MRAAALVLLALTLSGCQSTQETSARLEKAAKLHERSAGTSARGLAITRPSSIVKVIATAVVHSAEGTAAAVTLRNTSSEPLRDVPIEIHVRDARGTSIYANNIPGLGAPLTSVASIPAHGELTWVDDQIQAAGAPASVTALVGAAPTASGPAPPLTVSAEHLVEDPASGPGAAGSLFNGSAVTQRQVVVYAVARRAGRIVGAGRAVLPEVAAHHSAPFQLYFIGEAKGARLELSAAGAV